MPGDTLRPNTSCFYVAEEKKRKLVLEWAKNQNSQHAFNNTEMIFLRIPNHSGNEKWAVQNWRNEK